MTLHEIEYLHFEVNKIHEKWDSNEIGDKDAKEWLIQVCNRFIKENSNDT